MQVTFRNLLKAYSGKCDGLVYYYNAKLDKILCRRLVYPKISQANKILGDISINLSALEPSDDYIQDLKHYAILASKPGKFLNWRNAYMRMFFKLRDAIGVDLLTIDRDDIFDNGYPVITVRDAIDAGLLEPVVGYQRLSSLI